MKAINKGFTILEITVVISIIGLLAAVILFNYQGEGKQFALLRSAHQVAQKLRQAEEMAMSSQKTPAGCEKVEEGVFPKGGYGIHFAIDSENSENYYIYLFADCDGEGDYDNSGNAFYCEQGENGAKPYSSNSLNEIIENITLEEGVRIKSLSPVSVLDITFTPPDPEVTIFNSDEPIATIVLCLKNNENIFRTVKVYKTGLINTE